MGESYIIRVDGSWVGSTGTRSRRSTTIPDQYSEYTWYMLNRHKVNNLVSFDSPELRSDQIWCLVCNQKRRLFSKEQMLNMRLVEDFTKKVEEKCESGKSYLLCMNCADIILEPESTIESVWDPKKTQGCPKHCTMEEGGLLTYGPKYFESEKKWYFSCSKCGYRIPLRNIDLVKRYKIENNSFIISQPRRSAKTKKLSIDSLDMTEEEQREASAHLGGGQVTSKVAERNEPPPG